MTGQGVWRTVGGRRVFIKDGQSLADAMKESGKFPGKGKTDYSDFSKSKVKETLYHGSPKDFDEFDPEKSIEGNGAIWFSESEDYPESMIEERGGTGYVFEVKINTQNPMEVDLPPNQFTDPTIERKYVEKAKSGGYDAVIFTNKTADEYSRDTFYAVFSAEQVRIEKKRKM